MKNTKVVMIVAMLSGENGVENGIGYKGDLPWKHGSVKADMSHFKAETMGHPVIMGRKTWESIPKKFRPLVGRDNIVITRSSEKAQEAMSDGAYGAFVCIEDALAALQGREKVYIIGGAQIYEAAAKYATNVAITFVEPYEKLEADTFFPGLYSSDEVKEKSWYYPEAYIYAKPPESMKKKEEKIPQHKTSFMWFNRSEPENKEFWK